MKRALNVFNRTPILAIFVVVIVASMSFALFNVVSQPAASPSAALTPTPTPTLRPAATLRFPTPWPSPPPTSTPLPTPDLGPTRTPTPIIPTPAWTPIPPIVTNWITFKGKSGFSFSYPAGWDVVEEYNPNAQLQKVNIGIINWRDSLPRNTTVIPGGVSIHLMDIVPEAQSQIPKTGPPFTVGPQKFPGYQFVYTRENPPPNEPWFWVLERGINIYFTAGNKPWSISASFYPPTAGVGEYTQIFYRIIGSLNYAAK